MRDVNRLNNFYYNLNEFHKNIPDWRFGQLIMNFMNWYMTKYKTDIFYIEDDKILNLFNEFMNDLGVTHA